MPEQSSCATCDGVNAKCEQECMMEAAVKDVVYFDDEELDAYKGRPSDQYTDKEAEEFADVMYTMRPEEVKEWNRSLIMRGINMPNQIKDDFVTLASEGFSYFCRAIFCRLIRFYSNIEFNLKTKALYFVLFLFCTGMLIGCSTQKNTAKSRWWHSFTARYNTYYNGTLAYIEGSLNKEQNNQDNYTEIIPL